MDEKRQKRKREHLQQALELPLGPLSTGWEDVHLIHQALLKNELKAVDISTVFLGKTLKMPLIINALTGGALGLEKINASLARAAAHHGVGMAVGSQTAGVADRSVRHTYEVVRKENPDGLILANISALAEPQAAMEAVAMIRADALQLHLNGLQELLMAEGDRDFTRLAANIAKLLEVSPVPVMIKEVGCGLSRETALELYHYSIRAVVVSGAVGKNFAAIELARRGSEERAHFSSWGLSSAVSLLEVMDLGLPWTVLASGGLTNALQIGKALSLGAEAAGLAGSLLKILLQQGEEALNRHLAELAEELKILLMLTGASTIQKLREQPLVITGATGKWCEQRGINTAGYARRKRKMGVDANEGGNKGNPRKGGGGKGKRGGNWLGIMPWERAG